MTVCGTTPAALIVSSSRRRNTFLSAISSSSCSRITEGCERTPLLSQEGNAVPERRSGGGWNRCERTIVREPPDKAARSASESLQQGALRGLSRWLRDYRPSASLETTPSAPSV